MLFNFFNGKAMQRGITLAIGVIIVIGIIAAGYIMLPQNTEKQSKNLVVWYTYEGYDTVKNLTEIYAKNNNLNITIIEQSSKDFLDKFMLATQTGSAPDVIIVPDRWLYDLVAGGYLQDLSGVYTPSFVNQFESWAIESSKINGSLYMIPLYADLTVCVIRSDLIKSLGLPQPNGNWTISELIDLATGLNSTEDGRWGVIATFVSPYYWAPFQYAYGHGRFISENGTVVVNDTASIKAAELFYNITNVLKVGKDVGYRDLYQMFVDGKTGMAIMGSFMLPKLLNSNVSFEVLPLPIYSETGLRAAPFRDVKGFAVWSGSKNKELAYNYIKYLTSIDNVLSFSKENLKIPTIKKDLIPSNYLDENPLLSDLMDYVKSSQPVPKTKLYDTVFGYVKSALIQIIQQGYNNISEILSEIQGYINKSQEVNMSLALLNGYRSFQKKENGSLT